MALLDVPNQFEAAAQAAIALGSNLGDSPQILRDALKILDGHRDIQVIAQSRIYRTAPVGPPQPDIYNSCALLSTRLRPPELMQELLRVEQIFGRVRREKWGPRSLDLDLLLFDQRILDSPTLKIPHPRMADRAFVLVPLAEIAPDWIEPISEQTIAEMVKKVDTSGIYGHLPKP
ncbi:2-amino-4-hydroxy-6-hydroxymethyldihydropteridine diphosphokinase [filamentous cyanobacterium CCP5]|nr:2-amino-4-hydroxy-6-hydroxymethyldihydropteridine diphosphokinase [filamentous cyanobacterium CCP5]